MTKHKRKHKSTHTPHSNKAHGPSTPKSTAAERLKANLTRTLLQYLGGRRYAPMTSAELIEQLGISALHHETFNSLLEGLVASSQLSCSNDRFLLAANKQQLTTGTISMHAKGFGFVKVSEGPDVFIPKHLTQNAVDGDLVEIEIASEVSPKGPEGSVIAILKRSRSHLAGTILSASEGHFTAYAPLLGKTKALIVKAKGASLKVGDRVICKVSAWQGKDELVEGELVRTLGHISDPSIDIDAAIEEFELPCGFSSEAVEEAKSYGDKVPSKLTEERLDLTDWETVTIDPDTARDYDDAISLTHDAKGHYLLGVHIADVAHYVKALSHLDKEAYLRCNSTYFPGRCVPMLPEELSNELCSLKPKVRRLTMSVLAKIDKDGQVLDYKIVRSAIKSQKRFTYKEALHVLEGTKKSPHAPLLERMVTLCHLLKKKRFERGSIEFSMSDGVIVVDEQGVPQKIERVEYDITHQMIEEFMLKANELVAIHLTNLGRQPIYRIHEQPTPESFQDFFAFARSLGFTLPADPLPSDIQALFVTAKESPFIGQLSVSFIRSMRLAQYSPENIGHYGLALEHYCHFTSPIRRYTDLIIQRLLVNELPEGFDLQATAAACSEKERLSFKAEKSVVQLKKLRLAETYFKEDPARVYPAIVTRVKPFALFFEIPMFDLDPRLRTRRRLLRVQSENPSVPRLAHRQNIHSRSAALDAP